MIESEKQTTWEDVKRTRSGKAARVFRYSMILIGVVFASIGIISAINHAFLGGTGPWLDISLVVLVLLLIVAYIAKWQWTALRLASDR